MLRQQEEWLVDENLEATMPDGEAFAARLYEPEGFATSSGVIVPTTAEGLQRVWHDAHA
jgi:hypothetical protein